MSALPAKLFKQYRKWIEIHCWPVTAALSQGDFAAAREALDAAWSATDVPGLDPRLSDSYEVACIWHSFLIESKQAESGAIDQVYTDFIHRAAKPRWTAWGEQCRLKISLCIRLSGASHGAVELSGDEVRAELAKIDDLESSIFIWHYVTPWAFTNRDIELMRRAYETLVQDKRIQGQRESFLRVGLLHSLLSGEATPDSVRRYVGFISTHSSLVEFLRYILPECEAQGLASTELSAMLTKKRVELERVEEQVAEQARASRPV